MKVFEKLLKYNKVLAEWSDAVEWSNNVDAVTQRASKNVTTGERGAKRSRRFTQ